MKKGLLVLMLALFFCQLKAQYYTVPDANFASWLQANYPQCMSGNMMDTTCTAIRTETLVDCYNSGIIDIDGIQYFAALETLKVRRNDIVVLDNLPNSIRYLYCDSNQITNIVALPTSLWRFECRDNLLTTFPTLPSTLNTIVAYNNLLDTLPALPQGITQLFLTGNRLTTVPTLPNSLTQLYCDYNDITYLPNLPSFVQTLACNGNQLTSLPALSNVLLNLRCEDNQLDSLPVLPHSIRVLYASNIGVSSLTSLPDSLRDFRYRSNNLDALPDPLPSKLEYIDVRYNNLTRIPTLPSTMKNLQVNDNNISVLPDFVPVMGLVTIGNNPLSCLPELTTINSLYFSGTNITCLPNYGTVGTSSPPLASLPLCDMYNPNGCQSFSNISGMAYFDNDADCAFGFSDVKLSPVKIEVYENGQLLQQAFTGGEGFYSFDLDNIPGSYNTSVDSTFLPFTISCPDTAYYNSVITATDTAFFDHDFAMQCKQGFDIGAFDVVKGFEDLRPASNHTFNVIAGDVAQLYGASCAQVSGQVSVVLTGPATIQSYPGIAPTTINGDTLVWDVNDFGTTSVFNSFLIRLQVDTLAQAGDLICFDVTVTPTNGDNNVNNNAFNFCYEVINSFDPNNKEVNPVGNIDTLQEWLTYTINFQNTGNAPALHIYIMDTLDSNLDANSMQLLTSSHQNYTQVFEGGVVKFNFPSINLPDSISDEPGSHGYVRYKVKLKENLPIGTVIKNTANIYFDFNAPIVTNTTETTIELRIPDAIAEVRKPTVSIYPNPASTQLVVSASNGLQGGTIALYDLSGKLMALETATNQTHTINSSNLPSGIYIVVVKDNEQNILARNRVVIAK